VEDSQVAYLEHAIDDAVAYLLGQIQDVLAMWGPRHYGALDAPPDDRLEQYLDMLEGDGWAPVLQERAQQVGIQTAVVEAIATDTACNRMLAQRGQWTGEPDDVARAVMLGKVVVRNAQLAKRAQAAGHAAQQAERELAKPPFVVVPALPPYGDPDILQGRPPAPVPVAAYQRPALTPPPEMALPGAMAVAAPSSARFVPQSGHLRSDVETDAWGNPLGGVPAVAALRNVAADFSSLGV
jgi:hypothetical protein